MLPNSLLVFEKGQIQIYLDPLLLPDQLVLGDSIATGCFCSVGQAQLDQA